MKKRIAIIGCGASGMATAWLLDKKEFEIDVFEKEKTIGGRMGTKKLNGRNVSLGGKNIGKKYKLFRKFCSYFNESDFVDFGLNSSRGKDKKIKTFDNRNLLKSYLTIIKGITLKDILRLLPILIAVKTNRNNAYLSGKYFQKKNKRKILSTYFSKALYYKLLRPLTVRNNGAEPYEVSVANFGTNISMILDSYEQLKEGPTSLFNKFKKEYNVSVNKKVTDLYIENDTVKGIILSDNSKLFYEAVILATPAHVSASILKNTKKQAATLLSKIKYNPVAIIVVKYNKPIFNKNKRAWTFPDTSVLSNAGCYGKKELDVVRYTLSGKFSRELILNTNSIEELLNISEREVNLHTNLTLGKREGFVGAILKNGLCSYSMNHHELLDNLQNAIDKTNGLFLSGDYIEGVSIEACFESGRKTAKQVLKWSKTAKIGHSIPPSPG